MVVHVLCTSHCLLMYPMVLHVLCTSDCLLMYPMVLDVLCASSLYPHVPYGIESIMCILIVS